MAKQLMKGNEAIAEAAVRAGCRLFFGYPITPQNQIPEYMARRMPEVGGTFLQAESEVSAINMVYGAAGAGQRVMTSSSSPGISLKQEGISYIACAQLPAVIVNMVRSGPGLGGILPSQADYYQATRGGGHGDYRTIVLCPGGVQEACDLTVKAFDLADQYRIPVLVLGDGMIGQMMEPVELPDFSDKKQDKPWAANGHNNGGERRIINSLYIEAEELEEINRQLSEKYAAITANEVMWEEDMTEDAEYIVVAYGTMARIVKRAAKQAREEGMKVGVIRPITAWPFPAEPFKRLKGIKKCMAIEMSTGQMVDDVRLAVNGAYPVEFFGRTGGAIPSVKEVYTKIMEMKED